MKKINIGIIGTGAIVERRHAPEYSNNTNAEIAGFCDMNLQRAEEFAQKYGGKAYQDYRDMIKDPSIDAVVVCTSNSTHAQISIDALTNGKHVLCEKPMATTLEDCLAMKKAAEENNVKLMIAHNQRFTFPHQKAKEIIDNGSLGKVLWFSTNLAHPGPENFSVEKKATWYLSKSNSGFGVLTDLGIHKTDLLMWLLGERITEVSCMAGTFDKKLENGEFIDTYDNAVSTLKTENGIIGAMVNSYTNYGDWNNRTEIYLTGGVIKVHHNEAYPLEIITKDGERTIYPAEEGIVNSRINDAFVECIVRDTEAAVTAEQAINAMKVVLALNEANVNMKSVKIDY